ncbi:glutamine synthetase/guanido kinase [Paraphaeosphaeria sporulosa]|uniref:Glutamine synthetase n=1 Tax=Paraphaeosphaeria sporulosa TaxID=1460663 RepID=A0A177C7E4_9PLEO|nr:glutamine synthetase/guanido kinase [Paraphaeosphaeria sporulosa]OAG02620.1 glutamine synthetase/guanido kinase [Paraphaeosphaeria sporulosa]
MEAPPKPTVDSLRHVVNNFPIIDNHAHNIIQPALVDTIPLESITTEAQGRAMRDAFKSLPHLRAARQLRRLYECPDDANWEELLAQREEWLRTDPERLNQQCFQGVHALLIDDGLSNPDKVLPYHWHNRYTKAPSKRIVRIETVAERLMESLLVGVTDDDLDAATFFTDTWVTLTEEFEKEIQEAILDPEVAGFKTVICYRTGLDIEPDYERAARDVGHPFERYVERCVRKKKYRIERKALNDYLVLRTLEILSEETPRLDVMSKPLQLHTGLGDKDIDLLKSNPGCLQPVIENYTNVPFVLLHSAYPYTREAGYLATVYKNVYLDIGEVFPMVSRDGQKAILRQALEITPGSKLLYSSDGHYLPETYWLANVQFREVWLDLLIEYVEKEDVTPHQAIAMTKDILFNNSNILYNLQYEAVFNDLFVPPKTLTYNIKSPVESSTSPNAASMPPGLNLQQHASPLAPPYPSSTAPRTPSEGYQPPPFPPPPTEPQVYDTQLYDTFMQQNPEVKLVYVQWLDYMSTIRARMVPIKEFDRMMRSGSRIGISQGNTGTLQNDGSTPVMNPIGQIYVEPDLRSLRRTHHRDAIPSATVLSFWRDERGNRIRECPRANMELLINDLQYNRGIKLLCGFEIEVTFLRRSDAPQDEAFTPLTRTHAWGTMSPEQWLQIPLLAEIATSLSDIGIEVQQFHSESGQGQYEFVLAPQPLLASVDSLIQARQVVAQIAAFHGLRATLHPKPFPGIGTAAHAHISLDPPDKDLQFFVGGVLKHLPAICAFTLPEVVSYDRVADDSWTGGTWVAWGTQNREVPLRRVSGGRWEIRCLDGFANMYFAINAILAGGILGLKSNVVDFPQRDVRINPSSLDEEGRATYGITQKLPVGFAEAAFALVHDDDLVESLGQEFVGDYLAMKKSEHEMLSKMSDEERRVWLIERY